MLRYRFWSWMSGFAGHRFLGQFYMSGLLAQWRRRLLVKSEIEIGLRRSGKLAGPLAKGPKDGS